MSSHFPYMINATFLPPPSSIGPYSEQIENANPEATRPIHEATRPIHIVSRVQNKIEERIKNGNFSNCYNEERIRQIAEVAAETLQVMSERQLKQAMNSLPEALGIYVETVENGDPQFLIFVAQIGHGGYGTVYRVEDPVTGKSAAVKLAFDSERALKDIENEYQVVNELWDQAKKPLVGIQKRHYRKLDFDYISDSKFVFENTLMQSSQSSSHDRKKHCNEAKSLSGRGYQTHLYKSDLKTLLKKKDIPYLKAVSFSRQIIQGLNTLSEKLICHGDINAVNILVDDDECAIGDCGGADKLDSAEWKKAPKWTLPLHKDSVTENDMNTFVIWQQQNDLAKMQDILLKRDVYAAGKVIEALLTQCASQIAHHDRVLYSYMTTTLAQRWNASYLLGFCAHVNQQKEATGYSGGLTLKSLQPDSEIAILDSDHLDVMLPRESSSFSLYSSPTSLPTNEWNDRESKERHSSNALSSEKSQPKSCLVQ